MKELFLNVKRQTGILRKLAINTRDEDEDEWNKLLYFFSSFVQFKTLISIQNYTIYCNSEPIPIALALRFVL